MRNEYGCLIQIQSHKNVILVSYLLTNVIIEPSHIILATHINFDLFYYNVAKLGLPSME